MLFALICTDKPDSLELRMNTRPEHVAYLSDLNDRGILKIAGPFLNESDEPCGSLVVVEAENKDAARMIAENDPYSLAGLFAEVDIRPYNWTFNNPGA
ncbi:MAG: YciI-like protein [Pseudomonadota bacterium]